MDISPQTTAVVVWGTHTGREIKAHVEERPEGCFQFEESDYKFVSSCQLLNGIGY